MDAVKIMTIHKAKGLQFPAVIFPFATENRRNTRTWLWLDLEPDIAPGLESAIVKNNKELENTIFRDQYREEQEKSMLDLLNVLYVALTRAEEQLYILTSPPPEKVGEVDSIPKFFHHYLKTTGQFIENQSRFEFGQPLQRIKKNIKPLVETIPLNYFISNEWESRVKVRTRLDQEWVSGRTERSEWGTRVHAILSRITKGGDLAEAINQAIIAGTIEQAEAKPLENKLRELVNHPQLKELYSDNCIVRNEPEILAQQGSFYRPDRVVVKDGTATIIDYKTGEKRPEHAIQLEKYGSLVATMGYKSVRCLLIYLEPEIEVVEL
jgi:ATP-dependent exoDNAse (exonuclease V) beta subunit